MKNRAVILVVALFALLAGFEPMDAQIWGCKVCGWDAYGQAICLMQGFVGPEGGALCYAGQYCDGDQCYQICYTQQPCSWA